VNHLRIAATLAEILAQINADVRIGKLSPAAEPSKGRVIRSIETI